MSAVNINQVATIDFLSTLTNQSIVPASHNLLASPELILRREFTTLIVGNIRVITVKVIKVFSEIRIIAETDVKLGDHIGHGSFGSVMQGKWNDGINVHDVAVKIVSTNDINSIMNEVLLRLLIRVRCYFRLR